MRTLCVTMSIHDKNIAEPLLRLQSENVSLSQNPPTLSGRQNGWLNRVRRVSLSVGIGGISLIIITENVSILLLPNHVLPVPYFNGLISH